MCYQTLKGMENGASCEIGLVKNINLFDPYRRWNPLHWLQAKVLDGMFNRCWINGLRTGRFKPPSALTAKPVPGLKNSSDFIGVNYYTHLLATPFMPTKVEIDPLIRPWEQRTDFRYPMYAEGLRRAFDMVKGLNLPIIVTENGVADDDDDMRPEHIRRHLQVTAEAIADGSMSASKIRLLCASGDVATLHRLYNGLLEDTVINSLINDVREGLRLPPVSEIKAIAPPLPPRRSGRNQTMAGPREADTTSRAVMSGWTDVQRPPGSNAIGMSGVEHVRKIESEANPRNMNKKMKSLHLPSPSQGEKVQMSPPMDGKHGGRKTKRSRNKNKGSTKKRRKKSKAVHKKSKRRRLGKKNGTRRRARR